MSERQEYLNQWGNILIQNCHNGAVTGDPQKPIPISQVIAVNGPRAGALELHAGLKSDMLLRILSRSDCALLRQFVPWAFVGAPACYMSSRYVRVEAGWPDSLAEKDIKLKSLNQRPRDGGRWVAGINEVGQTVTLGLDDAKPHWLISGTTGSGKSFAMRAAAGQLCRDPQNSLVLLDGKFGDGLGPLANVRGLVGPLVKDVDTARAALSWAVGEMRQRYENPDPKRGRLVVVIDEVQELAGQDVVIAELLRKLTAQGRGAKVHLVMGTHHPTKLAFGDVSATKLNTPGRLALKVLDAKASEIAIGASTPRADFLLGAGDAYAITPSACHRAQLAYIPECDLADLPHGEPTLSEWPDYDPEAAGTLPQDTVKWEYSGPELGISLVSAHQGEGRRKLIQTLQEAGYSAGNVRADRLLTLGREEYEWLRANRWALGKWADVPTCLDAEHTPKRGFEAFLSDDECIEDC